MAEANQRKEWIYGQDLDRKGSIDGDLVTFLLIIISRLALVLREYS